MSELLTPQQLAERYEVPLQTIYYWNHRGTGPARVHLGRLVRYRLADVIAWEDSNRVQS